MIPAGDRARGRIDGSAFPLRRPAEVLAEVVHLGYAETVLRRHGRARFVDAGCNILPGLVHRVVFDEERFAPAGDELHQPRADAGKRCLDQRPLPVEDRLALVLKVEDFPHWPPLAKLLADNPTLYYRNDECTRFISRIPVTWDETRALKAVAGKFAVVAKRKGDKWYVGAINGSNEGIELEIPLDFLTPGKNYTMTGFEDGINAFRQAMDYRKTQRRVNSTGKATLKIARNGGWAAVIE